MKKLLGFKRYGAAEFEIGNKKICSSPMFFCTEIVKEKYKLALDLKLVYLSLTSEATGRSSLVIDIFRP